MCISNAKKQKARTKGVKMMTLQSLECWGGKVAGVAGERGRCSVSLSNKSSLSLSGGVCFIYGERVGTGLY